MRNNFVHLDCGRKYFSPAEIFAIIDYAADAGFGGLELAFGNDGFRFLLNDMSLPGYSDREVRAALHLGNQWYDEHPKFGDLYVTEKDELTETDMDEICFYAQDRGLEILPLLETPGHMHTLLSAMETLGMQNIRYQVAGLHLSHGTVDVKNQKALEFLKALVGKYAAYFASRGSRLFNLGADEYANDFAVDGEWVMGLNQLVAEGDYPLLMAYLNDLCGIVKDAGLRPMAFNDCIYYGGDTRIQVDNDLVAACWTGGWRGYLTANAEVFRSMGHEILNCHGDYYWVANENAPRCSPQKAAAFDPCLFPGDIRLEKPYGSMFCIWCDGPAYMTGARILSQAAPTIRAFGKALEKES